MLITLRKIQFANKTVLWITDSDPCASIIKNCASNKPLLNALLIPIFMLLSSHNIALIAKWIPRANNEAADQLSKYEIDKFCHINKFIRSEQVFASHDIYDMGRKTLMDTGA